MTPDLEALVRSLEVRTSLRLPITSALRPGDLTSSHGHGFAVDIGCTSSRMRYLVTRAALLEGITRLGLYDRHIHIDIDPERPQQVLWLGQSR